MPPNNARQTNSDCISKAMMQRWRGKVNSQTMWFSYSRTQESHQRPVNLARYCETAEHAWIQVLSRGNVQPVAIRVVKQVAARTQARTTSAAHIMDWIPDSNARDRALKFEIVAKANLASATSAIRLSTATHTSPTVNRCSQHEATGRRQLWYCHIAFLQSDISIPRSRVEWFRILTRT